MKNNTLRLFSSRLNNKIIFYLVIVLIAIFPFNKAIANATINESDSLKYPRERFSVSFGGFLTGLNNDIVVGSKQVGLGVTVNLEDALGLKSTSLVLRSEVEYNFGKRGRSAARFGYFGYFRNAKKVLETELEIGEEIFPIGTELDSKFDLQIFRGAYDYAFYMDERIRFGGSIGLFVMPISFSTATGDNKAVKTKFTAPLPVLGLSSDFAITQKIHFKQSIEILYLKFSNFKGILADINVRLEYNPWNHLGFGLGLNSNNIKISLTKESNINIDFVGSIETSFTGLLFYGRYYF